MTIVLRVDGKPTGKGRPRFVRATGHAYTPDATQRAESHIRQAWIDAGRPRIDGPVQLLAEIAVARPKGHWTTKGALSAAGLRTPLPSKKPDVDNALKLIFDSLNGCAYRDDVDVVHATVIRRWANPGELEHTMVRLDPAPIPGLKVAAA